MRRFFWICTICLLIAAAFVAGPAAAASPQTTVTVTTTSMVIDGATISHSDTFGLYASSTTMDGDTNGDTNPDMVFDWPNGFHSIIVYSANNTLGNYLGVNASGNQALPNARYTVSR